jgi:hypothetical protein
LIGLVGAKSLEDAAGLKLENRIRWIFGFPGIPLQRSDSHKRSTGPGFCACISTREKDKADINSSYYFIILQV